MSKGVTFTRKSADRISNVVREVENRPYPINETQRHRGGGLGRSTLWEITEIQNDPEQPDPLTCTIRRVTNTDWDLNEPSEKTAILYDPDNEPAVGDRGLLIRLGSGSLFFFKREVALNRVYVNEYCYVERNNPDTNYGYPTLARQNGNKSLLYVSQRDAVFKFSKQLPSIGDLENATVNLGTNDDGIIWTDWFTSSHKTILFKWELHAIREDFDASAITWNILQGLSTSNLGYVSEFRCYVDVSSDSQANGNYSWAGDGNGFVLGGNDLRNMLDPDAGDSAYGFYLRGDFFGDEVLNVAVGLDTVREELEAGTGKYSSWIEWF